MSYHYLSLGYIRWLEKVVFSPGMIQRKSQHIFVNDIPERVLQVQTFLSTLWGEFLWGAQKKSLDTPQRKTQHYVMSGCLSLFRGNKSHENASISLHKGPALFHCLHNFNRWHGKNIAWKKLSSIKWVSSGIKSIGKPPYNFIQYLINIFFHH